MKRAHTSAMFLALALAPLMAGCTLRRKQDEKREARRRAYEEEFVQIATSPNRLIFWEPRERDISRTATADREQFIFILKTAINVSYTVKRDDCLDRVIRNQFFVSGIRQPRAYTAYKSEIEARNPWLLQRVMRPEDNLNVPSGPQYAALESTVDTHDSYLERMHASLAPPLEPRVSVRIRVGWDSSNSDTTQRAPLSSDKAKVSGVLSKKESFQVFQRLGHFARAYPSPEEVFRISNWRRKSAVSELVNRRVLPLEALRPGLDGELVSIYVPTNTEVPSGLWPFSAPQELAQLDDPDADPDDSCGGDCKTCSELLTVPALKEPSKGRLLLVDSGVDSDLLSPLGLYYGPLKNPPAAYVAQDIPSALKSASAKPEDPSTGADVPLAGTDPSQLDFSDLAWNHHGTFVYGQLVQNGLLPPASVKVARVAVKKSGFASQAYVMAVRHVFTATSRFVGDSFLKENAGAPVWVASFSFGGEVTNLEQSDLGLKQTPRILYVVAAGNVDQTKRVIGANYVYAKFNGTRSDVLVVGALNSKDHLATYTKTSKSIVDLFARGSCDCGGAGKSDSKRQQLFGTSQATPIVATAAMILADRNPLWDAYHIKWRLISTTDLLDELSESGIGGKLNLNAALDYRSLLSRVPLHKTVGQKVRAALSHNQTIEITSVDKTSEGWGKLLNSQAQVLRLSRLKTCTPGYSCFRRILFEENADWIPVPDTAVLPYVDKGGNKISDLQAKDLVDVTFVFE